MLWDLGKLGVELLKEAPPKVKATAGLIIIVGVVICLIVITCNHQKKAPRKIILSTTNRGKLQA